MKITILAFGIAKEILGNTSTEIILEKAEISVKALKKKLVNDYPELDKLKHFSIAVNENYVSDDYKIAERDEVVILPPVSGG